MIEAHMNLKRLARAIHYIADCILLYDLLFCSDYGER